MQSEALQVKIHNNGLFVVVALFCLAIGFTYSYIKSPFHLTDSRITNIEYLVDIHSQHTLNTIINEDALPWQSEQQGLYSFGLSDAPHWFKFTLPQVEAQRTRLLVIGSSLLDDVSVWFEDGSNTITEYHTGDSLPFAQRPIDSEHFLFLVPEGEQLITVYVRVQTSGLLRLTVDIWPESDYLNFASEYNLIMGLFFGFMLAIGITNLFYFFTTKISTFAVYAGYVVFLALSLATFHGLGYKYLWPNSPWLQLHALPVLANITVCFSIVFCDLLLDVKRYSKKISKLLKLLALLYCVCVIMSLFVSLSLLIKVFLAMLLVSGVLIYGVAIWLWIKGISIAGVYTLAWSVLFIGGLVICLDNLNIVKFDLPSTYIMELGAALETLLLTLIISFNIKQQSEALQHAQSELLTKAQLDKKDQEALWAAQENAKEDLEYKVQERTLELEIALRELSETNRELQEKNTMDDLTGIRNRSYFDKKYIAEIRRSRRERTQLSIVMLDIDHFKSINDKYGHLVGDECIIAVARTLGSGLKRPSDDLCRYGGEEFVLILPSTELAGATALVEQIRQQIEDLVVEVDNHKIKMTISAGIATAIANPQDAEDVLLAAADQQLYMAKNAGRNNVKGVFLADSDKPL